MVSHSAVCWAEICEVDHLEQKTTEKMTYNMVALFAVDWAHWLVHYSVGWLEPLTKASGWVYVMDCATNVQMTAGSVATMDLQMIESMEK